MKKPATISPDYWDKACRALKRRDPVMKQLITDYKDMKLRSRGDPFYSMLRAIVGQQISTKAADTIWGRLEARLKKVTPRNLAKLTDAEIRAFGFSERKVEYARTLQEFFMKRNTHAYWDKIDDEQVLKDLIALRGVGRWTAEMFLMFCLMRPDVLPVDDLGILKAIGRAYHNGKRPTAAQLAKHRERWAPWNTVASWYLWRTLDPVAIIY